MLQTMGAGPTRALASLFALATISWFPGSALAGPAGAELDGAEQAKTLLKAAGYHRSAKFQKASNFVLAIIEDKSADPRFFREAFAAFEALKDVTVGGKPIVLHQITYTDLLKLKSTLIDLEINAVYIPAGSRSIGRNIVAATRELKILSIAGQSDYVHWLGTALGVESRAGKPKLMINLSGCKLEGVEFDPRLLRLASVFF